MKQGNIIKHRSSSLDARKKRIALVMLIPAIIYFGVFVYYPVYNLFKLSFFKYNMFSKPIFIGLKNFIELSVNKDFLKALGNTVYFAFFTTFFLILISFSLAIVIEKCDPRVSNFYKIIYFIPYITPMVAVALIWQWIYLPGESGLLNYLLSFFGISPQSWLYNRSLAMPAIILLSVWSQVGYYLIIFIAGLKGIPREYYEAAKIDGANKWQEIFYITFPSLMPIFQFVLIICTLQGFKVFTQMYVLTQGGPVGSTMTIVYEIYRQTFQFSKWGYGSAEAVVLFLLLLILSFLQRRITRS